jgi:hypothetical protein
MGTPDEGTGQIPSQESLFSIPFWEFYPEGIADYHNEMTDEVLRDISTRGSRPKVLAHQTQGDPFQLPSPGWATLDGQIRSILGSIFNSYYRRWREGELHIRRWAIVMGRLNDEEAERLAAEGLHNHLPALLSFIYYLNIPEELSEPEVGGTRFHSPLANLFESFAPRSRVIAADAGKLVVFPAYIDHEPIPITWADADRPRVVLSGDVYFTAGRSRPEVPGAIVVGSQ